MKIVDSMKTDVDQLSMTTEEEAVTDDNSNKKTDQELDTARKDDLPMIDLMKIETLIAAVTVSRMRLGESQQRK